jgi:hypothetical protein
MQRSRVFFEGYLNRIFEGGASGYLKAGTRGIEGGESGYMKAGN